MADDSQTPHLTSKPLATPAPTSTTVELAKLAFDKLGESTIGTLTKGLDATTTIAEKGVIPFLLGTGVLLAFYGLSLKIEVHGKPLANLSTGEFIAVFVMASLLMMAGASLRAWTYTSEHALRKAELRVKLKVLEATAGVAEKGMQASSGIAQANANIAVANAEIVRANTDIAKAQLKAGADTTATAVNSMKQPSGPDGSTKDPGAV